MVAAAVSVRMRSSAVLVLVVPDLRSRSPARPSIMEEAEEAAHRTSEITGSSPGPAVPAREVMEVSTLQATTALTGLVVVAVVVAVDLIPTSIQGAVAATASW